MKRSVVLLVVLIGCGSDEVAPLPHPDSSIGTDVTISSDTTSVVHPDSGVDTFRQAPDHALPPDSHTPPDAGVPDTQTPDVGTPDTLRPDSLAPDTLSPDTLSPDTLSPDLMSPDTQAPAPDLISNTCRHVRVQKNCYDVHVPGDKPIRMCKIPAGCFTMGAPANDACRFDDEDLHLVWLTRSFEIQEIEGGRDNDWEDAVEACNNISRRRGLQVCYTCDSSGCTNAVSNILDCKGFRLPTEAEWEYAYRAGATTQFYHGDLLSNDYVSCGKEDRVLNDYAVYRFSTYLGGRRSPRTKLPNAWGLYDMAGNLQEWVHDTYTKNLGTATVVDPVQEGGTRHVIRGGDSEGEPRHVRGAFRRRGATIYSTGFRCARTLED